MILEEEIAKLRTSSWEIDCPKMVLRKNDSTVEDIYQGAGYIKYTTEGELLFKLYTDRRIDPKQYLSVMEGRNAGKLIPITEHYTLTATDTTNRTWKADYILPDHIGGQNQEGHIVHGKLPYELISESKLPYTLASSDLSMMVFENIKLPYNTGTETKTYVDEELWEGRATQNITKITSRKCDFTFYNKNNSLTISVSAKCAKIPKSLDKRVIETTQFILGRSIEWVLMQKQEGDVESIIIKPVSQKKITRFPFPPLNMFTVHSQEFVWKLFDKYLSYIYDYEKFDRWHPMSMYVYRVNEANLTSIETRSLAVPIAVEGILNSEFSELASPSDKFLTELKKAREIVSNSELPKDLHQRIIGSINSMKRSSATDKLRSLVKDEIIKKEESEAWKKLRNYTAHANQPIYPDLQELVKLCDIVTLLFYKLIFYTIGFEGKYTDYGTYGWPTKDFHTKQGN